MPFLQTQAEQHRLEMTHGKKGAADAQKTEEYLRSAAEDAITQLISRRFESLKLRETLMYVLGGCDGNALLPSHNAGYGDEELTMESLFGSSGMMIVVGLIVRQLTM